MLQNRVCQMQITSSPMQTMLRQIGQRPGRGEYRVVSELRFGCIVAFNDLENVRNECTDFKAVLQLYRFSYLCAALLAVMSIDSS